MFFRRCLLLFAVGLLSCCFVFGGDWGQWRGPNGDGSTDEKSLPDSFDNILWEYSVGVGSSTPVVSGGKVFVSSEEAGGGLFGVCVDAKSGKEIWKKQLSETGGRKIARGGNMAVSSPVTDGERVFFLFDDGVFICLDYKGKEVWSRNLETEYGYVSVKFGCGATPLYYDGKLYIYVQRRPEAYYEPVNTEPYDSFLLAVNPLTGKTIYKHVRKTDVLKEAFDAYSSPVAFEYGGRKEILLVGGNFFTGHDPATGKELWRFGYNPDWETWATWRTIVSPVVAGDVVVCCQPRKGTKSFAVKGGSDGLLVEDDLAWVYEGTSDSPTPLYYEGDLYFFDGTRKKVLTRVDGKSGKEKWSGVVPGKNPYYASFTGGDGKMYCISDAGEAVIVAAGGDEMKILAQHNFGGRPVRSSIAIADGKLFIRTSEKLYCIGTLVQDNALDKSRAGDQGNR